MNIYKSAEEADVAVKELNKDPVDWTCPLLGGKACQTDCFCFLPAHSTMASAMVGTYYAHPNTCNNAMFSDFRQVGY